MRGKMMHETGARTPPKTKPEMAFREFERQLRRLLLVPQQDLRMSDRTEAIIPPEERRRVWRELQRAGFDLPRLNLSCDIFIIMAFVILEPVLVIGLLLGWRTMVLSFIGLSLLAHRLTRPLAIHPPIGCETVQELVMHMTRVVLEEYKAGLWTHGEIAAKVRQFFAEEAGVPVRDIKEDTRLLDLFP
jgi:hypothetical protein